MTNKNEIKKTYKFNSYVYDVLKKKRVETVYENGERELFIKKNKSSFDKDNNFYMFDLVVRGKSGRDSEFKYSKKNTLYKYAGKDCYQYIEFANEEDKKDFLDTMNALVDEFYNNIVIDENQKFYFDLSFGNYATYATCKEFTQAMKTKLLKEVNLTTSQYYDISKYIVKASQERNGLTYNELKEVVIRANERYYDKLAKYEAIKEPSVAELRASGNDGLADMKELEEMINRNNFCEVRDY